MLLNFNNQKIKTLLITDQPVVSNHLTTDINHYLNGHEDALKVNARRENLEERTGVKIGWTVSPNTEQKILEGLGLT